jgi:hypothetical protein
MSTKMTAWTTGPDVRLARLALALAIVFGGPLLVWKSRTIDASFEQFFPLVFLAVCSVFISAQALRALAHLEQNHPDAHQARAFIGMVAVILPVIAALTIGGVLAAMR